MEINNFILWTFVPELQAGSEILCPNCGEWSGIDKWSIGSLRRDKHGGEPHSTLICPACQAGFDYVYAEAFKSRTHPYPPALSPNSESTNLEKGSQEEPAEFAE